MVTDLTVTNPIIAVVIPCYRERMHVLDVIASIRDNVSLIFVIDDACPDKTGEMVRESCTDPRVHVIEHKQNKGVGGAMLSGYRAAVEADATIIVKLDGDGQMDPRLIPDLVAPIVTGKADYAKGNRLHRRQAAQGMPLVRLLGNVTLTLFSKISSGYWEIMDPTNGFTAIHAEVARELPFDDIAENFFFESDLLCKLSALDAVVVDVPMQARYGEETSHLSIPRIIGPFLIGHIRNTARRLMTTYFVKDIGIGTLALIFSPILLLFGVLFGSYHWLNSYHTGVPATAGTVILAALPIILGVQLVIMFLNQDVRRQPKTPVHLATKKSDVGE